MGSVYVYHQLNGIPLKTLTSDVTAAADVPLYYGIQSQIGIFFWAAAAAICFLCGSTIKSPEWSFFMVSGFLSLFLGLDDIFLFHEVVFPSLGIHQKVVYLSYVVIFGVYVLKFYKLILQTEFILLAMAFGCFGLSLLIDSFFHNAAPLYTQLIEDGAKFVGIVYWTIYFYSTATKTLKFQKID
ncbi:hypothetical protein A9Q87_04835 [Flavobacteriales bacterium 34_180_T64]|nr:hypothetical protein A9Q87_04835 [Flavobacteriales bacterium 34_180_T64]